MNSTSSLVPAAQLMGPTTSEKNRSASSISSLIPPTTDDRPPTSSARGQATVDDERAAGNKGRGVARQVCGQPPDVVGLADPSERRARDDHLGDLFALDERGGEAGGDEAGRDGVDADLLRAELDRQRF